MMAIVSRFSIDMTEDCARAWDEWWREMWRKFDHSTLDSDYVRDLLALSFREGWAAREGGRYG